MPIEDSLQRLRENLNPPGAAQGRIRARLMQRIEATPLLERAKIFAAPSPSVQERIWQRVLERIEPRAVSSLLGRLRDMVNPEPGVLGMIPRFAPVPVRSRSQRVFTWTAAALVLVVLVRMTPLLFLAAPRSSAESAVLVVPTRGSVAISMRGLWELVKGELQLKEGASFRTEDGEATFTFNDDGNIRIDQNTDIIIHDVTDRPEPALGGPTISVMRGRVWVQGYVPDHIRGIVISTPRGDIAVHEGSVAISVGETVDVRVWDRHARITRSGERDILLVAGERTELGEDTVAMVKKVAAKEYEESWPSKNLAKDAVHRREIAMLQRERTAARAGILPTSPFYSVKRVAEAVDVLLTFDEKQKVEKQLHQASLRLDEAAAILAAGGTGTTAQAALDEYKNALLSVAGGSGDTVTQFLVRQRVVEDTAQLAAALPDDSLYLVKKAVLQASADLPAPLVDAQNIEGVLFLDTLDIVSEAVEAGDVARAKKAFAQAQSYLQDFANSSGSSLSPEVHKEAISLLSTLAVTLEQQSGTGYTLGRDDLLETMKTYLPPPAPTQIVMTEEEAERIVQRIYNRVFVFKQSRSRWSQLMYEMKQLEGNSNEGTLLRHLYRTMPENGLAGPVRTRIVELGKERAGK